MELHCQRQSSGEVFINYAMLVHPYTLIYTLKKDTCHHLLSHRLFPAQVEYFGDHSSQPIRAYGRYIYGKVEEGCSANWGWGRGYLEEGSLLYL